MIDPKSTITFTCEGSNNPKSRYYSRRPHWPGGNSGVTIGRGYDLAWNTMDEAVTEFRNAGMEEAHIKRLYVWAGVKGVKAGNAIKELRDIEISAECEIKLFEYCYKTMVDNVVRILGKRDVVKTYGIVDFYTLSDNLQEFLVDLHFRGDFTPAFREHCLLVIRLGDIDSLMSIIKKQYTGVWPACRMKSRLALLKRKSTDERVCHGEV